MSKISSLWAAQREFWANSPGTPFDEGAYLSSLQPEFRDKNDLFTIVNRTENRKSIQSLEKKLAPLPSVIEECTLRHFFAPGCYGREMTIPKGTLIVGKIHKHAHLNIISKGRVRVMTEAGPLLLKAPHTFVSEVGTKRVVFAEEETIWTTIHITDQTDLGKIEDEVIAKSYDDVGLLESKP